MSDEDGEYLVLRNGELARSMGGVERVTVVLEVRPGSEYTGDVSSLTGWMRRGGLEDAARVAGFDPREVTHVRITRRDGEEGVLVSVEELAAAMAREGEAGEGAGGGVYRTKAERVAELEAAIARTTGGARYRPTGSHEYTEIEGKGDLGKGMRPHLVVLDETDGWTG